MVRLDMFACLFDRENSRCRIVSTQGVLKLLKTSWAAMEDFPGAFSLLKKNKEENIVLIYLTGKSSMAAHITPFSRPPKITLHKFSAKIRFVYHVPESPRIPES